MGLYSTPGVLNLALRVLNLVIRVLNLVPDTQYPVLYRENPIENFPRQKSHPRQRPPPPPYSGLREDPNLLHVVYFRRPKNQVLKLNIDEQQSAALK